MTWVLDSTVLVNFGRTETLWMLEHALIDPKVVVEDVVAEIMQPRSLVTQLHAALADGWMRIHRLVDDPDQGSVLTVRKRWPKLGSGESASLAACIAWNWGLASDDQDARRIATTSNIDLTGTIGILLRAVRRDIVDLQTADDELGRMIAAGYFAPVRRLADLIE